MKLPENFPKIFEIYLILNADLQQSAMSCFLVSVRVMVVEPTINPKCFSFEWEITPTCLGELQTPRSQGLR